ncbi:iron-containing alcohol dehydrogenase [Gordonia sp. JH63]|jgi:alcohol dehydrogenase class IV|uniref:Iron-containing alcohol dehydrogenase n=1 Tax=Gordonia hongkongensis TaxID=1701090 RepID=A0AAX3TBY6_9ACTN|nr:MULTISPECIES: iron-containing alcohol dehydrogenase [Gordonia]MCZ4536875.1 iron-containing alcohol dehydrogenase [Gordonia terrae]OCW88020.1 alcohol dehydrogenase [Nocardia farcinica]MBN0973175.1 iron-containing alcohol dehydrogenase [Gordonia sp. BP-119]MBN0983208.1 iron-containing alcohol dehydrogenase [Gordonia sp. BP-94]OCH78892.1 alcohol dehydrogenase [Gordonia sp. UCD-TK1]
MVGDVRRRASGQVAKFHTPEIVLGPGAFGEVPVATAGLGMRRPFVVSDRCLERTPWYAQLMAGLRAGGLDAASYLDVSPNPRSGEVAAAFLAYKAHDADGLVALGGGSVIDAAKGVAVLAANGGHILEYEGIDRARRPLPPLIAVPTTAGSGADVSQFCIINDAERRTKVTIIGRSLVPDVTVSDPTLLMTAPAAVTAQVGMDVLTHCVEAYVSLAHGRLTDSLALESIRGVWTHLERLVDDPRDRVAAEEMSLAALRAGMAFTNAILGATHAMSHPVGGHCDAPHGAINAVLLPHVIRYNAHVCADGFVDLADAIGVETSGDARTVADRLADAIAALGARVGMPASLEPLGVRSADLDRLTAHALADSCMTTNPRRPQAAGIRDLYAEAL